MCYCFSSREVCETVRTSAGQPAITDDAGISGMHDADATAGRKEPCRGSQAEADDAEHGDGQPK